MATALRVKPEQIWPRHESYRDRMVMCLIHHSMTDSSTTEGKLTRENYANSFNKSHVAWVSERKSRKKNFLFMQLCRNKIREQKVWCKGNNHRYRVLRNTSLFRSSLTSPSYSFPLWRKQNTCIVSDLRPTFKEDGAEKAFMEKSLRRKAKGGCEA